MTSVFFAPVMETLILGTELALKSHGLPPWWARLVRITMCGFRRTGAGSLPIKSTQTDATLIFGSVSCPGVLRRDKFDPSLDQTPIWNPDGKQILFSSSRKLGFRVYLKNADGSGGEEELQDLGIIAQVNPWDCSHDGKYVLIRKQNEPWYLAWPERVARPLLQAKWTVRNAQFSPDG
jgi:hypothetical protein